MSIDELEEAAEEGAADGSAAAEPVAGAGEPVCASVKDNVVSNATAAPLNRLRELAIIMMEKTECECVWSRKQTTPYPDLSPLALRRLGQPQASLGLGINSGEPRRKMP